MREPHILDPCGDSTEEAETINYMITECLQKIKSVNVNANKIKNKKYKKGTIVILDNGAEVTIFKDKQLMNNLREAEIPICVDGIQEGAEGIFTATTGDTAFGTGYYSSNIIGNILSFGDCVDNCHSVDYDNKTDTFLIQPQQGGEIFGFRRDRNNLYTCDLAEVQHYTAAIETVSDNKKLYSKREIAQAEKARNYQKTISHTTAGDLIKMISAGKIKNCDINVQDVVRSVKIWGKELGNIKGKTTAKTAPTVDVEDDPIIKGIVQKQQFVYIDLMFVDGAIYLIGVYSPSGYGFAKRINSKKISDILDALNNSIAFMRRAGFEVILVRCDGESAIESEKLKSKLSTEVDNTGGESVGIIERKIRTIKERVRAAITTLPYQITEQALDWLIQNVMYFINYTPSSIDTDNRSPSERVKGRLLDARTDLKHMFGEYVQIGEKHTDNTSNERTRGAIALMPAGNREGSWWYLILKTMKPVKRNWAVKLPMPDEVIEYLNLQAIGKKKKTISDTIKIGLWRAKQSEDMSEADEEDVEDIDQYDAYDYMQPNYEEAVENVYEEEQEEEDYAVDEPAADQYVEENAEQQQSDKDYANDNNEELGGAGNNEDLHEDQQQIAGVQDENIYNIDNNNEYHLPAQEEQPIAEQQAEQQRYNLRNHRAQQGRWRGIAATKIRSKFMKRQFGMKMTVRQGIKKLGYQAVLSVVKEVMQLLDMSAFEGQDINNMNEEQIKLIITSSTFLKDKYTAQGVFDKLKARLVAGGHLQDREIYDNGASPTVATTSLFMIATIAAKEGRSVATIDFPGAFLHSTIPQDGPQTYMKLNKFETMVVTRIDPSYLKFVRPDGTMIVKLTRALYGCVESARLWYDKISSDLEALGYKKNKQDICVFNRIEENGMQSTIVIHVDDLMMTADTEQALDKMIGEIKQSYENLTIHRGRILEYLGMVFDFTKQGICKITMDGYIIDLLKFAEDIEGTAKTPANDNLFSVNEESEKLDKSKKEFFHSGTAKLLYLGKRVRPDILTAVSFLTKRVQEPTVEDLGKLERVFRYIRGTKQYGIRLEGSKNFGILGYIDASFGVHKDMKSHSGVIIGIGKGPIYAKSSTQKINTTSSTESELVALSDSTGYVIWMRNFLIEQGYEIGEATIYQDNQSTIAMVKNGKSNSNRTRHIAIRFFFVADRVRSKEIKIEYMQTGEMLADILTKPLQGKLFTKLRNELLNWYDDT